MALLLFAVVTMLIASLFFVLRFSWLYLALLGFQAPGAARELAWGWLVGMFKDLATVAGMSFVISYYDARHVGVPQRRPASPRPTLRRADRHWRWRCSCIAAASSPASAHLTERLRAEGAVVPAGPPWRPRPAPATAAGWAAAAHGRHVRLRRRPTRP